MKKTILIVGDSFAADWTKKYKGVGWVNMLESDFNVTNIAEAGVSEYKILKQLNSVKVNEYNYVITSHTSAYRIPVKEHPIHFNDALHKNCDLIYTDLKEHQYNILAKVAVDFYSYLYDIDYALFTHELILKEIQSKFPNMINITFFDLFNQSVDGIHMFENIFLNNKGQMNHLNELGNEIIYNKIQNLL
jgi:hypothetical protein